MNSRSPQQSQPETTTTAGFAGINDSFIAIYDAYFKRVYNYVCYRVGEPAEADDLTGLVFEALLAHFDQYDPARGPFEPWLFGIARNTVNQSLRRRRFRWLSWDIFAGRPAPGPLPEEAVESRQARDRLVEALSHLDNRARDLLGLKFVACLTNRQIALLTGLKESHVGVILFRAIQRLRDDLQSAGFELAGSQQEEEYLNGRP